MDTVGQPVARRVSLEQLESNLLVVRQRETFVGVGCEELTRRDQDGVGVEFESETGSIGDVD